MKDVGLSSLMLVKAPACRRHGTLPPLSAKNCLVLTGLAPAPPCRSRLPQGPAAPYGEGERQAGP